jgi:hypothetical protein
MCAFARCNRPEDFKSVPSHSARDVFFSKTDSTQAAMGLKFSKQIICSVQWTSFFNGRLFAPGFGMRTETRHLKTLPSPPENQRPVFGPALRD